MSKFLVFSNEHADIILVLIFLMLVIVFFYTIYGLVNDIRTKGLKGVIRDIWEPEEVE